MSGKDTDSAFVIDWIARLSSRPRPAGSRECARAARLVRSSIESSGSFTIIEDRFEFQKYNPSRWGLTIDGKELRCLPAICSTSTPRSGLVGELCRSESADVHGKIALVQISSTHESIVVEEMAERGAIAALVFQRGRFLLSGRVRYPSSSIPCLMIQGEVGEGLWNDSTRRRLQATVTLRANAEKGNGTNVLATPKGARSRALYVAHRDSRPFSQGAIDNGSGTSLILLLAKVMENQSFSLLSTDAEEYGLVGARHFAAKYALGTGVCVVNLDSLGVGDLHLIENSRSGPLSPELNSRISSIAKSAGVKLRRLSTPRGSDSDAFIERGSRAAWLRSSPTPTATTVDDSVEHISRPAIQECCLLLRRLAAEDLSGA